MAITPQRLIVVGTGFGGAPRDDHSIPYEGLEVISRAEKEFVLGRQVGSVRRSTPDRTKTSPERDDAVR
jgi:hypothetical protein